VGGVLASQWNPRRALTGGYWDALGTAPLLARGPCRSALVLGLGAGAVVQALRRFVRPARIVGVEADPSVLRAGSAAFRLRGPDLRVVVGDARRVVEAGTRRFDLVVDDVYEMVARRADRPAGVGARWFAALARRVAPGGVLAVNFVDPAAFRAARPGLFGALRGFSGAFRFDFDRWHNVVVAATRGPGDVARYESAFAGAVPGREARGRGFHLTRLRVRAPRTRAGPRKGR
jgi:hypothetical protein